MKKYLFFLFILLALIYITMNIKQEKVSFHNLNLTGITYVDSRGIVYNRHGSYLYKSYNSGKNWILVISNKDLGGTLFIDSKDNIFIGSKLNASCPGLYSLVKEHLQCSLNLSYFNICQEISSITHMTEDKIGNIYAGLYTYGNGSCKCGFIFKSSDRGKSWVISYNSSAYNWTGRHIHNIKFNPYNNYIYASQGDGYSGARLLRSTDFGESWETINDDLRSNYLAMEFTPNYRFFGEDFAFDLKNNSRIVRTSDDINFEQVFQLKGDETGNWLASGKSLDGTLIFGTFVEIAGKNATLYLSYDEGATWEKIKDFGIAKKNWTGVTQISNMDSKGYLYVYDTINENLIRIRARK